MAIDPSLSLQVNPVQAPDYLKFAKFGLDQQVAQQQMATSAAQQANLQAANPGIAANATSLQQKAQGDIQDQAANNLAIELAQSGKYTTDNGTDNATIDYAKLYGDLAQQFPQQATKMAASKFDTDYKEQQARTQAATASGTEAETAGKWTNFSNNLVQTTANIIDKSSMPAEQKPAALQAAIERQAAHYPDAFANSPYVTTVGGGTDANGQPVPTKPVLTTTLTGSDVKSIANGSMDPLTSSKLQISQNELALAQLQASPEYKAAVSQIPDSGTRAAALQGAAAADKQVSVLNSGLTANVPSNSYGKAGSVTQDAWNKLVEQGGPYALKQAAIDQYNANHPGANISIANNGVDAVNKLLAQETANVSAVGKTSKAIATKPTIASAAEAAPASPNPAPGPAKPTAVDNERALANRAIQNGKDPVAVRALFKKNTGQDL